MSLSRCGTNYKRAPSQGHRRRSADKEQANKAETDSFWAVKTPMKVKMQTATSSPNLAKHNWQRKKQFSPLKNECTHCGQKISMGTSYFKCSNANCNANVHEACKSRVTAPCVISHETVSSRRALVEVSSSSSVLG